MPESLLSFMIFKANFISKFLFANFTSASANLLAVIYFNSSALLVVFLPSFLRASTFHFVSYLRRFSFRLKGTKERVS